MLNFIYPLRLHPTTGNHNLNKPDYTVHKYAFTQVPAFLGYLFLRRKFKKIFIRKVHMSLPLSDNHMSKELLLHS